MLVNLYVSKNENCRGDFIFQAPVHFNHTPMKGDGIAPDTIEGLAGGPFIIIDRQHGHNGELDVFAVED